MKYSVKLSFDKVDEFDEIDDEFDENDEEFDEYLDIKYLIENLQFTRIKDNEIKGDPLSVTQKFIPKRIAHVKSKKEKFSILLYALLCLVIINMTLYSGIELYMTNKNLGDIVYSRKIHCFP